MRVQNIYLGNLQQIDSKLKELLSSKEKTILIDGCSFDYGNAQLFLKEVEIDTTSIIIHNIAIEKLHLLLLLFDGNYIPITPIGGQAFALKDVMVHLLCKAETYQLPSTRWQSKFNIVLLNKN